MKKRPTRGWYALGLIASILILFVRKGGLQGVQLGMDLAGGVRLSYLIDYSKYEEQFTNDLELQAAKQQARDIITVQVDNRVNQLGVSNYEAYTQIIDNNEYQIIELGGVPDVEAAKAIIGKTVELEFGIQNNEPVTPETQAARAELSQSILDQAQNNDLSLEYLGSSYGAQGVYFVVTSGSIAQLPTVYQNTDIINQLQPGQLSDEVFSGLFQDYPTEVENFGLVDQRGYVITRLVDRSVQSVETYTAAAFSQAVPDAQSLTVSDATYTTGSAIYSGGQLIYPIGPVLPGQAGYDLIVYTTSATDDLQALADAISREERLDEVSVDFEGWIAADTASLAVPGFSYTEGQERLFVSNDQSSSLIRVRQTKQADQELYDILRAERDQETAQALLNELTNPEIITVESLFVDEVQPRLPAVDETTGNILNGAFFEFATVTQTQLGAPAVSITFNDAGKGIFCRITGRNIGQQLAIFVGGELKTSPVINEEICGGQTQISGQFTREETQTLARDLNEGALPAPLILSQEEKVSPVLGDRSLQQIILAGGVGILAIVIYMMLIYGYRQAIITAIGLVSFLIFVFALLKLIGAVLGLSGLAAIILTIGMSVDAMILMFERIDENISTGSSKRDAIRDGANQAWSAVRDGNASTGLIGIILLFMGVGMFKGFGTMMVITIIFIVLVVYPMTKVLATLLITDD